MPDFPWYVWAGIGALFVLFVWPLLNGLIFGAIGAASSSGQKNAGA